MTHALIHFEVFVVDTRPHVYLSTLSEPYNSSAGKGKQMMIGGSKSKTAFTDGYFEKKFDRIMEVKKQRIYKCRWHPCWGIEQRDITSL